MSQVEHKLTVLSQIAKELNQKSLSWAVGASLLLYFKGIVPDFHDIDIMVTEDDVNEAKAVLLSFGTMQPPNPNMAYKTKHFMEFIVEGVEIDVMAGFVIVNHNKEYQISFGKADIKEYIKIKGVSIPLQSVEAWRTYYQLMGRSEKVELIDAEACFSEENIG
jgi:hypothetical protein